MAVRKKKKNLLVQKSKQILKREGAAFLTYGAMLAGAVAFYMIFKRSWEIEIIDWIWLIIAVPLFGLPRVFDKLRSSQEPSYLIRFAHAFKEGFLSLSSITSDLINWTVKIREFLEKLSQKDKSQPNN